MDVMFRGAAGGHSACMSLVESTAEASLVQPGTTASRPRSARVIDSSHQLDGVLTRSERIGFWLYVAMGIVCVAVLVAAAVSAIAT
jgi:hypothetical protein